MRTNFSFLGPEFELAYLEAMCISVNKLLYIERFTNSTKPIFENSVLVILYRCGILRIKASVVIPVSVD